MKKAAWSAFDAQGKFPSPLRAVHRADAMGYSNSSFSEFELPRDPSPIGWLGKTVDHFELYWADGKRCSVSIE